MSRPTRPLAVAALTTVLVASLSTALPERHAATGVGLAFLAATYVMVLRRDDEDIGHYGLSLGGLLEPGTLSAKRLVADASKAILWAAIAAAIVFPLFWFGFVAWWQPKQPFAWRAPDSLSDDILGHLLVIALPEEAFYRGYLQTALDDAWPGRLRVLGADIGWGLVVTSAIFAIGHFLTEPTPQRLAVFFPSLLFGWLRSRTRGIGAPIAFHAMANLLSAALGRGYGMYR